MIKHTEEETRGNCVKKNMQIKCIVCGKHFNWKKGYTSLEHYDPQGVFGLTVCEECHKKEMEGK